MAKLRLTKSDGDDNLPAGDRGSATGRLGKWWSGLWQQGDNPLNWAIPLFRTAGISVRLSLLYVAFVAVELVRAGFAGSIVHVALAMASLLVLVLLHEFGHCFACRAVGGEADDVLLWPLGGLASCNPPFSWRAHFLTTAGGPLVNVVLTPILALGLLAAGVPGSVLYQFNPLSPLAAQIDFTMSWAQRGLWWLYYTNLVLLAFNVLVPMFPMDGGRLWQAVLWNRMGYRRSMAVTVNVGFVTAVALGMAGLYTQNTMLVGIAIFGGLTCYSERQRLRTMMGGTGSAEAPEPWATPAWRSGGDPADDMEAAEAERAADRAAEKAAEKRRREADQAAAERAERQIEIDRILDKIKATGMGSLSTKEKKMLQQETETKRRSG